MVKLENDTPEDRQALKEALDYVSSDPTAKKIIDGMERKGVTVSIVHNGKDEYHADNDTIYWDPKAGLDVLDNQGNVVGVRSAAVSLMHEGAHATDPQFLKHNGTTNAQYDTDAELYAVNEEDKIASSLGEPVRLNHQGYMVREIDPTIHTHTNADKTAVWMEKGGIEMGAYQPGTIPIVAPSVPHKAQTTSAETAGWRSFDSGSDSPVGQIGQEMDVARSFVQRLQQKNRGGAEQAAEREAGNGNPVAAAVAPALDPAVTRDMLVRAWRNEGRD